MHQVVSGLLQEAHKMFKQGDTVASIELLREAINYTGHEETNTAKMVVRALRGGQGISSVSNYFHLIFADNNDRYEIFLKGKIDLEDEELPEETPLDNFVEERIKEELKWKPGKNQLEVKVEGKDTVTVYLSFDNSKSLQEVAGYIGKNEGFDDNWFTIVQKGGDSGVILNLVDTHIKAIGISIDLWVTFFTLYNRDFTNDKLNLTEQGTYLDLDSYKNIIYSRDATKNTTTTYTEDMLNLKLLPPLKLDPTRKSESKKLLKEETEEEVE